MTEGFILSAALAAGPNPVVTGGGEEVVVTKLPGRSFINIASEFGAGNVIEVDNGATNGVIHIIDAVL